jgi:hypothetical protein
MSSYSVRIPRKIQVIQHLAATPIAYESHLKQDLVNKKKLTQ